MKKIHNIHSEKHCHICKQPLLTDDAKNNHDIHINEALKNTPEYKKMLQQQADLDKREANLSPEVLNNKVKETPEYKKMLQQQADLDKREEGLALNIDKHKKAVVIFNDRKVTIAKKDLISAEAKQNTDNEFKGEVLEDTMEDYLKKWFPSGHLIEPIKKGKKGGDILLTVGGINNPIGKIKYECKETQKFQNKYIDDLKKDMQLHGAKYGVLITKSVPPGYKHPYIVEEQGTIYIIESRSLRGIKALSEILMHLLVSIYKEKAKSSNTKEKEMVLNTHFSSDEGIEALKSLIKNIIEEDEEIEKRDSTHQVEMKRRKDKQLEIKDNFKKLFLPLLGIKAIRESTRDTPLLSLEEDF